MMAAATPITTTSSSSSLLLLSLTPAQAQRVKEALPGILETEATTTTTTFTNKLQTLQYPTPSTATLSSIATLLASYQKDQPALMELPLSMPIDALLKRMLLPNISSAGNDTHLHTHTHTQVTHLEAKINKAIATIGMYQRQQHELIENFSRLTDKYKHMKENLHTVLFEYLPKLEGFASIPALIPELEESESRLGTHYTLGKLVGSGHFATVRVCTPYSSTSSSSSSSTSASATPAALLVVKSIDKQHVKHAKGLQRIAQEIDALTLLGQNNPHPHPNILTLHHVLHGKHFIHLITERASTDLYDVIGRYPNGMPVDLAKQIIHPILDALVFCHAHGVVHRDLKPENILLNHRTIIGGIGKEGEQRFEVKICDFGLCTKVPPHEEITLTEFCGSPGFICPEMLIDKAYCGRKADMWSVGCMMLEMSLTSGVFGGVWMQTFKDEYLNEPGLFREQVHAACATVLRIVKEKPRSDSEKDKDQAWLQLLEGLLQVDPAKRFSGGEVERYLGRKVEEKEEEEEEVEEEDEVIPLEEEEEGEEGEEEGQEGQQDPPPPLPFSSPSFPPRLVAQLDRLTLHPATAAAAAAATMNKNKNRRVISPIPSATRNLALGGHRRRSFGEREQRVAPTDRQTDTHTSPPPPPSATTKAGRPIVIAAVGGSRPLGLTIPSLSSPSSSSSSLSSSPPTSRSLGKSLGSSGSSSNVRASLRAQTLLKAEHEQGASNGSSNSSSSGGEGGLRIAIRGRDPPLRPESPSTPLASPSSSSRFLSLEAYVPSPVSSPIGKSREGGGEGSNNNTR